MSKSITIPSDRGSRITVKVNGREYTYPAGASVTVPDEVAAAIENMLAMDPGGVRKSADAAFLEGVEKEIDGVRDDIREVSDDIKEMEESIDDLDKRVTALEEAAEDNGD